MILKPNFYVITGGPGVGKTTLLDELKQRGYIYIPEVARNIIKEQMTANGNALPWMDARKYSDLMLMRSVQDFTYLSANQELLFFDRGIPDTYGYESLMGFKMKDDLIKAVQQYRYNPKVFILPPWKEIYETDNERKQDFDEAVRTYHALFSAYKDLEYTPVNVPLISIKGRADFILENL